MLRQSRDGSMDVVRADRRLSAAAIEQARDITLLILTQRKGYSIRLAAAYLGMPHSTAHDRLRSIPEDARERYLSGKTPIPLV